MKWLIALIALGVIVTSIGGFFIKLGVSLLIIATLGVLVVAFTQSSNEVDILERARKKGFKNFYKHKDGSIYGHDRYGNYKRVN